MKKSLIAVDNRIKNAVSSYNSVSLLREDGPLIEPYDCEIVNECKLDPEIVSVYESHISYIKSYFSQENSILKLYLNSIGLFGDIFEVVITVAACIEYVAATYLENSYKNEFYIMDVTIATIFLIDWVIHLVLSERKIEFLIEYGSIIDYLTIIPVYIEVFGSSFGVKISIFRVLRVFRSLRILRFFKILQAISEEEDERNRLRHTVTTAEVSKQILITSITLLSTLFIGAGIVNSINDLVDNAYYYPDGSNFDFLAAFYYMIVTSSTLGYGDIYPIVTISRMITVLIILVLVFIITNQVSKMSQLMENYSKYDTQYYLKNHIVILGNYHTRTLVQFLSQFYDEDHGDIKTQSIIVGNEYPSSELIGLINDPRYEGKIFYLEGNPSQNLTWKNANIDLAESVFVLTDQLFDNLHSQDVYAVLLAKMIQVQFPLIKTYMQLIRPLEYSVSESSNWNTAISIQTIKMSLLGTSIHNTGFSTMINGLYLSFNSSKAEKNNSEWIKSFAYGLGQEIYCVRISDYFISMPFNQAVDVIYTNCKGILTLGVKSLIGISSRHEIFINPVNYIFQRDDLVFVITSNQQTADLVTNYNGNYDYKTINVSSFAQIALAHNFQTVKLLAKEYTCELKDHSVIDLVQDDLNGKISKHVLIFGGFEGFEILIKAIRVYSEQPICLVNSADPGLQWKKFERYENIFYFKGNTANFQDLYNTGIKDCYSALLLANSNRNASNPDSEVVLLTKLIEYSFPGTKVLVELIDKSFIRFLGKKPADQYAKNNYNLWPNYLSGKVYFSSYLDSFIAQTYYNKDLVDILMRVMGISFDRKASQIKENSIIKTIKVPKFYFEGKEDPLTYGEMFKDLLNLNPPVILLGVLSKRHKVEYENDVSNDEQTIVLTNPPSDTMIEESDKIICLGEPNDEIPSHANPDEELKKEINHGNIFKIGLADLLLKAKNTSLGAQNEPDKTVEDDTLDYVFNILKKRMEGSVKLQKDIDKKNKLILELQKEADELKEKLINYSKS